MEQGSGFAANLAVSFFPNPKAGLLTSTNKHADIWKPWPESGKIERRFRGDLWWPLLLVETNRPPVAQDLGASAWKAFLFSSGSRRSNVIESGQRSPVLPLSKGVGGGQKWRKGMPHRLFPGKVYVAPPLLILRSHRSSSRHGQWGWKGCSPGRWRTPNWCSEEIKFRHRSWCNPLIGCIDLTDFMCPPMGGS